MIDKLIINPFQKFVKIETFSGILLFSATILALVLANSPLSGFYHGLWEYKLGISTGSFELNKPLILWINDGLMAVFFFLIGLEIKRELIIGELNTPKKAAFPFFAALGGVLAPVFIFLLINRNPETSHGWGIPMAADIAFVLAILKLLGNRIPLSLKVFLTAFAIIDDIAAVMVIAIFYSSSINILYIAIALAIIVFLIFLGRKGIYSIYLVSILGIVVWILFLKSGVHPTVAGVLLAFTIPIRRKMHICTFARKLSDIVKEIEESPKTGKYMLSDEQIEYLDDLEDWTLSVQSPLQHLEHKLHNLVAYFIMPLFAFANAGVAFSSGTNPDFGLISTIAISLFAGNAIGVSFVSFLTVKLKITEHPEGVNKFQVIGASFLAGVGFTMAIFIANLAYAGQPEIMDSAKIGVLIGSLVSGITGYTVLRLAGKQKRKT